MKKKVILDCDNTMGLHRKEIDDGITLLYLLGRNDIELLGITLTYGNGSIEEVEKATQEFLSKFNLKHLPIYSREKAYQFLVNSVQQYPQEVAILAIGSMTNLYEASLLDSKFYSLVKHIALMGGICEPIYFDGVEMKELNLSINATASYSVLSSSAPISIINAHAGQDALITQNQINQLTNQEGKFFQTLKNEIASWLIHTKEKWNLNGFINWDTAAVVLYLEPHRFTDEVIVIQPTLENLKTGFLNPVSYTTEQTKNILMPTHIKNVKEFNQHVCDCITNCYYKESLI